MDFEWSPGQKAHYDAVVEFARGELNSQESGFDRGAWKKAGEFGLAGMSIPSEWGGLGLGALDTMLSVEALGYGCRDSGFVFALCAHLFSCAVPVWQAGTDAQRRAFLEPLASGAWIGANATSEAEAGSDVFSMRTRAVRDGDDYVLNGEKSWVTNGSVADCFAVYATLDRSRGFEGVTCFLVPRDTPGVEVGPDRPKIGLRSAPLCEVVLRDCRVPGSSRLGAEGGGSTIFSESMRWERACLFALYVGAMQRQLEACVAYAKGRTQFGRPIGKLESVSRRVVDMALRLDASRLLLYRAGWMMDRGGACDLEVALSKLFISESSVQSGLDAIQIHGGQGCVEEGGVEVALRDAVPSRIFSGTSEIQRAIAARWLGL